MATKYPIILVHGIMLKDVRFFKAFGKIERLLQEEGYTVYTAKTDGVGTIETNARQLKEEIESVLEKEGVEKVNLIAHSKGGLDSRYMLDCLDMKDKVASVTFLCTPHKGSQLASKLYALPNVIKMPLAAQINLWYGLFGDEQPDALEVCRQLKHAPEGALENVDPYDGIFMQSYSTTMERSRDDFVMGIPLYFSRRFENDLSDGMVALESAKFAEYKGNCTDGSVSHSEIVDFMTNKKKKEKIYAFYNALCRDLAERGF